MTFANSSSQFVPDDQFSAGLPVDGATANSLLPETAAWQGGSSVDAILQEGVRRAHAEMMAFGQREDVEALMAVPFGAGYDVEAAGQFFDSLVMGAGVLPQVEVLDDSILGGAFGAYAQATDTVYMSRQFLETGNVDAITGVLLEEYGHGVDARVNAIDSLGDEGQLFSRLVTNQYSSRAELSLLKTEDDSTFVTVDGVSLDVEQSQGVIWRNQNTGQVDVWTVENGQRTQSSTLATVSTDWNIEANGDFDQDGETDLVWRNEKTGQVDIWFMNRLGGNSSFTSLNIATIRDTNWKISGSGDLNGDGLTDLVWRDSQSGRVDAWLATHSSQSNYSWNSQNIATIASSQWNIEAVSDLNSDGRSDLVWRDSGTGRVDVWKMNGPSWSSQTIANSVNTDWKIEASTDLTGDGVSDLTWRNQKTGTVDIWEMGGTVKKSSQRLANSVDTNWKIVGGYSNSYNLPSGLPSSASEADQFFKLQYKNSTYNPSGPLSSRNCGPASLAMIMSTLGLSPSGVSVETQIDHARYLMNNKAGNSVREGLSVVNEDGRNTNFSQIETGIRHAGGTAINVDSWEDLNQNLSEGNPMVLLGYYGSDWREEFPDSALAGSGNVDHFITVLGKTQGGKYIVADPMYRGGAVEMTKEQLSVFFNSSQNSQSGVPNGRAFQSGK